MSNQPVHPSQNPGKALEVRSGDLKKGDKKVIEEDTMYLFRVRLYMFGTSIVISILFRDIFGLWILGKLDCRL